MSRAINPDELVAYLRKWKVTYKPTLGWKTRNRNGHGAWGDVHGILDHHTAGAVGESASAENRVLKRGRADLPGPLCQFGVGRNGIVYLIGNGRCNHAGTVKPAVRDRFIAGHTPVVPADTKGETVDGNAFLYGAEWHNSGTGEHYPAAQLLSGILLNCAVLDFHRWNANSSGQHYEATARKTDMANIHFGGSSHPAGPWLRTEIAVALKAGPGKYTRVGWRPDPPKPPPPPPPPPPVAVCAHCCPLHCEVKP